MTQLSHPLMPAPFRFQAYDSDLERSLCRASRDEIQRVQTERIQHLLDYCYANVPFYKERWDHKGFKPADFKSAEDLMKVPSWDVNDQRTDLEAHPPFGSYYTSDALTDTAILLSTSGTTGVPRLMPVSFRDLPGLKDNFGRVFRYYGLGSGDLIHITFTYATMGAAWACTWAAEAAGVGVVAASNGRVTSSERQIDLIRRAGVTALMGTSSFLLHLANTALEQGDNPSRWKVRKIITAGEISSPAVRQQLEELWGAKVYDLFGSVDVLTWICCDCDESRAHHGRDGMHIWEDICKIEILDASGKPVPDGEYGELCITSWSFRTSPRVRFRTGDFSAVKSNRCACGRTLARLMPIAGRVDHTLRIHAQSIYPMALESAVLSSATGIKEWYAEALEESGKDRLYIHIEHAEQADDTFRARVEETLRRSLNLGMIEVILHPPGATQSVTGAGQEQKIRRIFDRRH